MSVEKIDYGKARQMYITGDASLAVVARAVGIAPSTLYTKSGAENWPKQRIDYRERVAVESIARAGKRDVEAIGQTLTAAARLAETARAVLDDPDQFFRQTLVLRSPGGDEVKEMVTAKMDTRGFADYCRGLSYLSSIFSSLAPRITAAEAERLEMERQRLELERQRTAAVLPEDAGHGVVILPVVRDVAPPPEDAGERGQKEEEK